MQWGNVRNVTDAYAEPAERILEIAESGREAVVGVSHVLELF